MSLPGDFASRAYSCHCPVGLGPLLAPSYTLSAPPSLRGHRSGRRFGCESISRAHDYRRRRQEAGASPPWRPIRSPSGDRPRRARLYIANHEKILQVGESLIAVTGTATFKLILRDYFNDAADVRLANPQEIFRTWNRLHATLKQRYYLMPEEDKEDALESSRMDVLIANPHGIFGVSGHRTVQEFSRFYAYGSGSDYALGALYSAYDDPARERGSSWRAMRWRRLRSSTIARRCPITSFAVRLLKP